MTDYDVVIVGSGFGGSVSALRLVEKGYQVGVLEAGRRFADEEFAKTSWHVRDYVFAPALGCTGIFRVTPLPDALVLSVPASAADRWATRTPFTSRRITSSRTRW